MAQGGQVLKENAALRFRILGKKGHNFDIMQKFQPDLVGNAKDAHFGVLHFQDGVFDHKLAAQVAVICGTHGIHLLKETVKAVSAGPPGLHNPDRSSLTFRV